jgi:hypothetical protein
MDLYHLYHLMIRYGTLKSALLNMWLSKEDDAIYDFLIDLETEENIINN